MLTDLTALIPPAWREIVDLDRLRQISKEIGSDFIPDPKLIFRSLECAPSDVKVVIVGQDPYPNPQHAMGLAFSVPAEIEVLPASLKNIYKELKADLGVIRENGDLSGWSEQGVLLVRTTDYTASNGTSLTSLAALAASDIVEVITFTAFELASAIEDTIFDAKGDILVKEY